MKKIFFPTIVAALLLVQSASAWNGQVHSGITAIAEANLTPTAKAEIERYLGGRPLTYYASWMDDISVYPEYEACKEWHEIAFNPKYKILAGKRAAKSDDKRISKAKAFDGLKAAVKALENRKSLSDSEVADNIRFLTYILADLHCPGHYLYTDLTPEQQNPKFYRDKSRKAQEFRNFWEGAAITQTHNWRANEFVHQLNRKGAEEIEALTSGTMAEWVTANARDYRFVYTSLLNDGNRFSNTKYRLWLNKIYPFAEEQAAIAGYRIAKVLNGLFDGGAEKVAVTGKSKPAKK